MASFRQGDIVLIPHAPFSDQIQYKARPALIISGDGFNTSQGDVICMAISSRLNPEDPTRVDIIQDRSADFARTGLRCTSSIKCSAIFAYQADQIPRTLGQLPRRLVVEAKRVLSRIMDL